MNSRQMLHGTRVSCLALLTLLAGLRAAAGSLDLDKGYVANACRSDFNAIKFSQLAVDKSTNPDVKAFAQQMITDHTALEQQMMPFANQWGVPQVSSLDDSQQSSFDKLGKLSGNDFDRQYVKMMDEEQHLAETRLAAVSATTTDKAFKVQIKSAQKSIDHMTSATDRLARKLGLTPVGADTKSI